MDVLADLGRLDEYQENCPIPKRKTEVGIQLQMAEEPFRANSALRHKLGRMHQDQKIDQCGRHQLWEAPGSILEQNAGRDRIIVS